MSFDLTIFVEVTALTLAVQLCGFLLAVALKTEVFYDILGGLNFLLVAFWGILERVPSLRLNAMTLVFCASRGWLLLFLAYRAHARGGDSRFDEVKGEALRFLVFWVAQAVWVLTTSWPLIVVQALDKGTDQDEQLEHKELSTWDICMLTGFALGVLTEITADIQKTIWVNSGRPGTFCSKGLWKFSRHPNYFGEIFQWWCAWLLSYSALAEKPSLLAKGVFALGILSPLFSMTILLTMSKTGIWNAEGKNLKRYYDSPDAEAYKAYRASTSPLIPMVGYQHVPLWIKQTFLFEWERFEYHPKKKE